MGRPRQDGFEYFPFDSTFFEDVKIRKLLRRGNAHSIAVYVSALCFIFKEGYYFRIDDDFPFLISEKTRIDEDEVRQCLNTCVEVKLFDKELFGKGILTSAGIQRRYMRMCSQTKRCAEIREYNLLQDGKTQDDIFGENDRPEGDVPDVSPEESERQEQPEEVSPEKTLNNSEEIRNISEETGNDSEKIRISLNKRKVKEKEKNIPPIPYGISPPAEGISPPVEGAVLSVETPVQAKSPPKGLEQRKHEFGQRLIPYVQEYGKEMVREFYDYWSEVSDGGSKMAWEKTLTRKGTFNIAGRLATWKRKSDSGFGRSGPQRRGSSISEAVQATAIPDGGLAGGLDISKLLPH